MWERMSASEGGKGLSVDFLSTHPANAKRIKQLENWMPEVSTLTLLRYPCPFPLYMRANHPISLPHLN